ncbi:MAG: hypothetical protein QOG91_184 [Candidatus Parcubacteria bacterium]|jgi:hypothetical protein|nr:hypothetical protein [Candidatus Parcubacteria bacterium]
MASGKKIVTYVPAADAEMMREAIAQAGGGKLGKYTHCSFSTKGIGRFRPGEGARPHIGLVGKVESVEEERIEVTCAAGAADKVIAAIKRAHPYEEIPIDIYDLN